MAPDAHAKLSPSGASRWSACPASIRATDEFIAAHPEINTAGDTIHSKRGTQAHQVCEDMLLEKAPTRPDDETLTDDEWEEMLYHAEGFFEYVMSHKNDGDLLLVEKRVKMSQVHPGMYGTSDVILYGKNDYTLQIFDFKYGRMEVIAEKNPQLMLYAVGAYNLVRNMGEKPRYYTVHVYQPRTGGVPEDFYEFYHPELVKFSNDMSDAAIATEEPDAPFVPGEKQCQWCPAAPTCTAYAEYVTAEGLGLLDLLDTIDDTHVGVASDDLLEARPETLTVDELVILRDIFPSVKKWMQKVEDYLLLETSAGKVPQMKIVEGRGANVCIDPDAVEFMVGDAAYKDPQLKSVTELKKLVGTKNFDHLLGDYFEKKPGKATMVSIDDPRPAVETSADLLQMLNETEE